MHLACSQRLCCVTAEMFDISWSIIKERSHVEKNYWQTRFRKKDMIAKGKWQYFSAAVAEPSQCVPGCVALPLRGTPWYDQWNRCHASFRTYSRRCRAFFWPLKNSETTRRDATCVPSRLTGSRLLHSGKCAVVASVLGCLVSKASCGFYEAHPEMYYGSADLRNFELFRAGISAHVSIWTQASNKCLTWECWQVGFFVSLLLRWASRFHGFGVQHSSDSMNYTVSQPSSTCRSGRRHHWRLRGQSAH